MGGGRGAGAHKHVKWRSLKVAGVTRSLGCLAGRQGPYGLLLAALIADALGKVWVRVN